MEPVRFDSFVKRLAGWSSRRRFIGALTSAAATGAFMPRSVGAQTPAAVPTCGSEIPDSDARARAEHIQSTLGGMLQDLDKSFSATITQNQYANATQFYEFVEAVRCLLVQAADAGSWNGSQVRSFLNQIKGIIAAFSVGFGGAFFSELHAAETQGGVRAQAGLKPSQVCGSAGCTADALQAAFNAYTTCHDYDTCVVEAFKGLIQSYLIGPPACVEQIVPGCLDVNDCCAGNCSCSYCISKH